MIVSLCSVLLRSMSVSITRLDEIHSNHKLKIFDNQKNQHKIKLAPDWIRLIPSCDCHPSQLSLVMRLKGNLNCLNGLIHSVAGAYGCIYGIPSNARRVAKFNPTDDSLQEIGPDLGNDYWKWDSGALAGNGSIYCFPCNFGDNGILKIDTVNETVTIIDLEPPETGDGVLWTSGALALDRCTYFMPSGARRILKFDPENESVASVGEDLGVDGRSMYNGTVLGIDGCLYGIPRSQTHIVRYNPIDQFIIFVGEEADRSFDCGNGVGVVGRDGCIYALSSIFVTHLRIWSNAVLIGSDFL